MNIFINWNLTEYKYKIYFYQRNIIFTFEQIQISNMWKKTNIRLQILNIYIQILYICLLIFEYLNTRIYICNRFNHYYVILELTAKLDSLTQNHLKDFKEFFCETRYRGEGLPFSNWSLTSISHVSKTSLKSLLQVSKKLITITRWIYNGVTAN
jgi:hypothetical protein